MMIRKPIYILLIVLVSMPFAFAADWPQLGNGPQRKNFSPESILPPYKVKWSAGLTGIDVRHRIHGAAQVIVGDGKAFIGTKSGVIFAFNAVTGAQAWTYQADGGIVHTLGYESGKVFAACMDGKIYAINSSNGTLAWKFSTGKRHGFSNAVLLAEDKVFAADRGGYLYAVLQSNGTAAWPAPYYTGSPIFQSPAYNEGKVFIGSEDMRMHAINSVTGTQVWRSARLPGQNFVDYWPVVHGGEVIVRPMTGMEPIRGTSDVPPDPWDPGIVGMVTLNENTGAILAPIAHYQVLTMSGPTAPPAVTHDGLLVVPWKLVWNDYWMAWGWALQSLSTRNQVDVLTGNVGAPDEIMISSVFDRTIIAIHSMGCFWGNPTGQNGAFNRITRTWHRGVNEIGRPTDVGAYVRNNNQAEGANAVSGSNGLLYHQTMDIIYCLERK